MAGRTLWVAGGLLTCWACALDSFVAYVRYATAGLGPLENSSKKYLYLFFISRQSSACLLLNPFDLYSATYSS